MFIDERSSEWSKLPPADQNPMLKPPPPPYDVEEEL
jgi:hypothetical protein